VASTNVPPWSAGAKGIICEIKWEKRPLFALRQYAHFVVAGIQFEKSITLFVSPLLFLFFIKDESARDQWRNVFLGMALVLAVVSAFLYLITHKWSPQANCFFWFLVTDQPAEFTKMHKFKKESAAIGIGMAERSCSTAMGKQRVGGVWWEERGKREAEWNSRRAEERKTRPSQSTLIIISQSALISGHFWKFKILLVDSNLHKPFF
jgi:hypothetical protein